MNEETKVYPYQRALDEEPQISENRFTEFLTTQINKDSSVRAKRRFCFLKMNWMDWLLAVSALCMGSAEILGNLYPFGIAFAAASVIKYKKNCVLYTAMVMAGYIFAKGFGAIPYLIAVLIIWSLLYFSRHDEKTVWLICPAMVFAVLGTVRVVASLFTTFITGYDISVIFFEGLFTGGLTVVAMSTLSLANNYRSISKLSTDELVCIFVMLLGCVSGLGDFAIAGISIGDVAGRTLIMLAALWGGAGAGAGVGAIMGIVPSLSMMASPATVGIYAFAGLLSGAFQSYKRPGVSAGFILGNIMLSLYVIESAEITVQLIASLLSVILLFLLPIKLINSGNKVFSDMSVKTSTEERSNRLMKTTAKKLKNTAWIYKELAGNCKTSAEENGNEAENINTVLNHLRSRICDKCSVRKLCWTVDINDTYRGVMELFNTSEKKGIAGVSDASENFQKRCPHIRELVATVNCLYELYKQNNFWKSQQAGSSMFLASQLEGTAQVLNNLALELINNDNRAALAERMVKKSLDKMGIATDGVQVLNFNEKSMDFWINFQECPGENTCRKIIQKETGKALEKDLKVTDVCCGNTCGQCCKFHLLEAGAKSISIGRAQLARAGKNVCGDCGSDLILDAGKQLLMISDGMGTGFKAALKSGTAISILSRLLEIGFERDTAIDAVNTILMLQNGEESFVTLDMCFIDLYDSTADFIKTGAAPSFIKKNHKVKVVKSSSLPVGMLQNVEKSISTEHLCNGDMIILASDGLLDADNKTDLKWLTGLLAESEITDPQQMAEYLLNKAITISGGRLRDDITILVAAIDAA
ncbi:MAG: stage II sporulation protein E [Bacillota bacterium]